MYGFNIYENFANGEFKKLTCYYVSANSRAEAIAKAQKWAIENYPTRNVDVMPTN